METFFAFVFVLIKCELRLVDDRSFYCSAADLIV